MKLSSTVKIYKPRSSTTINTVSPLSPYHAVDTPNQYPRGTSRSIPNRYSNPYLVDTRLTFDRQPVNSQWLICIERKLIDSQPTNDQDVDRVSV